MQRKRVGIAMSGGVDSTVSALLLKRKYVIEGFFMCLAQPDLDLQKRKVREIASRIGINLHIINLKKQFEDKILSYFSESYSNGVTPNPCMICNREIKFGLFMETMLTAGMDCAATGHYARIETQDGRFRLLKGKDPVKDQSYFLARLSQEQLGRIILPLGNMSKSETYALAEQNGFSGFKGLESQDVCFLGPEGLRSYLSKHLNNTSAPGPIVTKEGREIGSHRGLARYTVGQRRGLGLPDNTPWYVLEIRPEENVLIVGKEKDLYQDRILATNMHWLSGSPPTAQTRFKIKIRSTHRGAEATVKRVDDWKYQITFDTRQRAVTPGQFAVIYQGDEVMGSGEITRIPRHTHV